MKKVMILGAGSGQVPFLKICRSKGYEVIVVSVPGDYPGFKLADKFYFVDTRDKDTILKIARDEKIDAILTDQTDVSVPTVAFVAEKMDLRGIGYETALKFTDKYLMRKAAKEAGVGVPAFDRAFNVAEAVDIAEKIGYPLIIKPVDSSGSRGVRRIDSPEDLKKEFDATKHYSLSGTVILEGFIEGKEYLVDGYAMDYEYCNLDLGIKEQFNLPGMYMSKMCMFSSAKRIKDRVGQMVLEANKKLATSMRLPFGITHAEYRYNKAEDKVYLIEIAARGGGDYISSDLTALASGFSTNEPLVDYIVNGNIHKANFDKLDDKVAAWLGVAFPADGIVRYIKGLENLQHIHGVYRHHMDNIFIGKKVHPPTDDTGRYGLILIHADTEDECYKIIGKAKNTLDIEIETADGIKKQIW